MLDADQIHYFPKADGSIASLQEVVDGIGDWLKDHLVFPWAKGGSSPMDEREGIGRRQGRRSDRNPFFDAKGWLPVRPVRLGRFI